MASELHPLGMCTFTMKGTTYDDGEMTDYYFCDVCGRHEGESFEGMKNRLQDVPIRCYTERDLYAFAEKEMNGGKIKK